MRNFIITGRLLLLGFCLSASAFATSAHLSALEKPNKPSREKLKVGTLYGPDTYLETGQGAVGFDFDLSRDFAKYLGRPLDIYPFHTHEQLFDALARGEVDMAAAALTVTSDRVHQWQFGPPLYHATPQVVYRLGSGRPKNWGQLKGRLLIAKGSSHAELLNKAKKNWPSLQWEETAEYDTDQLLGMVASGELDYTLGNSQSIAINKRFHPELRVAFDAGAQQRIAWAMPKSTTNPLLSDVLDFWNRPKQSLRLKHLKEKYFGHVRRFDYVDTRAFIRAYKSELAAYEPLFRQYAGQFDWRKLAAISYQESHWNPKARSPTGVRGLMMLTRDTARLMRIKNRLDPEQSIRGGSAYLLSLLKRLPPNIPSEEAIWFAMAAYNIGLGHLEDARVITQTAGYDPNSWPDVKRHLPLLRQRKHYENTKHGYARGDEAANYVDNIRRYYDTLVWLDQRSQLALVNKSEQRSHLQSETVFASHTNQPMREMIH